MTTPQKLLAVAIYSLLLASTVYYLSPTKTITVTKTEIDETSKQKSKSKTHSKSIIETHPDGTSTTTTVADNSTDTNTDTNLDIKSETSKEVTRAQNGPTIGVLAGLNITHPQDGYFFAGQISFPVPILPVSIILQGATNKTAMLGLTLKLP